LACATTGVLSRRFTVAVKSASRFGKAVAQAGWAAHSAKIALKELAGADHHVSAMLFVGGDTESRTTLRMPCG
jgi:hypothetical protein